MNRFHARNRSEAVLQADPQRVWGVLTDPRLLTRFTPNLRRIDVDGDRWRWHLTRIPVLSQAVEPSFTEIMEFDEPRRIVFRHDGACDQDHAGVDGEYHLTPHGSGTKVAIDLGIWVDVPAPRVARPAVERVMSTVVAGMGYRFGQNMRRHLGERA